jgi:hypothetical protein
MQRVSIVGLFILCDQKYRLGKQSGKEGSEQSKDGKLCKAISFSPFLLHSRSSFDIFKSFTLLSSF